MADVARLAGVAPMTVPRVVNGDNAVAEVTRARVQLAIDQLGYRSSIAARTLAGGRSRALGAIGVATEYFGTSQTLFGIERAASAPGHTVAYVTVREPSVDQLRNAFDRLQDAHVGGRHRNRTGRTIVEALSALMVSVPVVATSPVVDIATTVSIDQTRGAQLATAQLLDLGHHTVHHARGPHGWLDADARVGGWRKQLRAQKRHVPSSTAR